MPRGRVGLPLRRAALDALVTALVVDRNVRSDRVAGPREFLAIVTSLMALGALGIDLMLPAFPDIRREFGMASDSARAGQIITAFFLGMAAGPLLYGPAADRFGRRRPLFAGLALYVTGAVMAAFAPSFGWILVARFIWGLGAAGPRSLSLAMIRDRYEGPAMARLMSMIMAVFVLVPILAPGFGSVLNLFAPWRIMFWVPAIVATAVGLWAAQRLPETLAPDRRRAFSPRSIGEAAKAVVTNRRTVCFTLAVAFLFGVMTSYLSGSELIVEDVYGYGKYFPFFFGAIAVLFGMTALNNARIVNRLGLDRLVRQMAVIGVLLAGVFCVIATSSGGRPNFWVFTLALAAVVPMAQGLVPNCNTGAMMPLPHVAGTASAIIAMVTTAGGSVLGGVVNNAFDGTVRPFAYGVTVYLCIAAALILFGATSSASAAKPGG